MENWSEYIFYILVLGIVLVVSLRKRKRQVLYPVNDKKSSWEELMHELKRQQVLLPQEQISFSGSEVVERNNEEELEPITKLQDEEVVQLYESVITPTQEGKPILNDAKWKLTTLESAQQAIVYSEIMKPKYL